MFNVTLQGLWARKRRLLGTCTAVILGVAFLAATLVLGDTMRAGFAQAFSDANAGIDVVVRSSAEMGSEELRQRDLIDDSIVDEVAAVDGVRAAVPSIEGVGTILDADGDRIGGNGPPTTATNWIDDAELNPYRLAEGRAPAAPDEVVIDRGAAKNGDLAVGDRTTILTPDPVEVTVVGIATFGDVDSLGPTTYTAFTLDAARDLLANRPDGISAVLVAAEDGVNTDTLRDEIEQLMPARIEALTQSELTAEQQADIESDFLGFFQIILLAFAGIALIVATFSIHNTFSILVAQRTRESALLRAIGASRRQILSSVTGEALAIGIVASAIGIGVGLGLATGLLALMGGAGLDLPTDGIVLGADTFVIAAAVGVVTTLVASITPALKASRVAPLAALRDVAVDRSATSVVRAVAGSLIAAAGIATVITATTSDDGALGRAGLGALGVLVGAVVLGPVVARPAAAVLGTGASVTRGFTGRLARRNAMRNPRRIASSASALMVGTAVVALFTTFGASIKASIDDAVDTTFTGDLVVLQEDFSGATMPTELAPAIAELPEVDDAVGVAFGAAAINGEGVEPTITEPAQFAGSFDLGVIAGSLVDLTAGQVAVSEQWAEEHTVGLGDTVTMSFVDGVSTPLEIGAVYTERMSFEDIIMTREDWAPHARQSGDTVLFVELADGVSIEDGKAAIAPVTERFNAPDAQTRDEYLGDVSSQIDQMLFVVYGLLGIAVLIALMGIGNTLSLSIHERTRELGLLRAVGQSRSQLRSALRWESVIVAVFGTIGGVALGTFLGWGLMRALSAEEGFGSFALPVTPLAVILGLAAVAGIVASLRPARRAARLDILEAIATD